jgi:hypothetical protein
LVALAPVVIFTAPVFEQVAMAVPATEVGAPLIIIVRCAIAAQPLTVFVVNLRIAVPLKFAAAV